MGRLTTIIIVGIIVAVVVLGSAAFYSWLQERSLTLEEIGELEYEAGDTQKFHGTITDIYYEETNRGNFTTLALDDHGSWAILAEPQNRNYQIGDEYEGEMEFVEYTYNGARYLYSDVFFSPFYGLNLGIQGVMDSVSLDAGLMFDEVSEDDSGMVFEVMTRFDNCFPLDLGTITVKTMPNGVDGNWVSALETIGIEYVRITSGIPAVAPLDTIGPLDQNRTSDILTYTDTNSNNCLDDGDRLSVAIPPTEDETVIDTYYIQLNDYDAYYSAHKYIINNYQGSMYWSEGDPEYQMVVDDTSGILTITDSKGPEIPIENLHLAIDYDWDDDIPVPLANLTPGSWDLDSTLWVNYSDTDSSQTLGPGDWFEVDGMTNGSEYRFALVDSVQERWYFVDWAAGYGALIGEYPDLTLTPLNRTNDSVELEVNVSFVRPEFQFGSTMTVTLFNGSGDLISNASLVDGFIGGYVEGDLTFEDTNGDGNFSTGDRFLFDHYEPLVDHRLRFYLAPNVATNFFGEIWFPLYET